MRRAGVELLADLDTLAVMGLTEVLRRLPSLLRLRRRVGRYLEEGGVDLFLPVDYPEFNLALSCRARRRGIPVLYFIAPQVWAWRPGRAKKLARCASEICVVLPFEEEFFARHGADVRFVGHPLLDEHSDAGPPALPPDRGGGRPGGGAEADGESHGRADPHRDRGRVLGLFPGSRVQEVERILPVFLDAAHRLRADRPGLRVLVARAPDLPPGSYPPAEERIELLPSEEVLARSTAALTKSGTVTLQLAIHGVPMVVGYRMNPVTHWIARRLVTVDHIALVNLVAGHEVVPELIQAELTPAGLAAAAAPFLEPGSASAERVRRKLGVVRRELGRPGCARRVARTALDLLESERRDAR